MEKGTIILCLFLLINQAPKNISCEWEERDDFYGNYHLRESLLARSRALGRQTLGLPSPQTPARVWHTVGAQMILAKLFN